MAFVIGITILIVEALALFLPSHLPLIGHMSKTSTSLTRV
jgi:hypothetical protein